MTDIVFTADDKRLGAYNEDGGIAKWPELDCFGNAYDFAQRVNAGLKRVDAKHFALIPSSKDTGDLVFKMASKPMPDVKADKDAK